LKDAAVQVGVDIAGISRKLCAMEVEHAANRASAAMAHVAFSRFGCPNGRTVLTLYVRLPPVFRRANRKSARARITQFPSGVQPTLRSTVL
jgi:hypothetical protein